MRIPGIRIRDSFAAMEKTITPLTIMEPIREMTGRMAVLTTATVMRARETAAMITAMAAMAITAIPITMVTAAAIVTTAVRPEGV